MHAGLDRGNSKNPHTKYRLTFPELFFREWRCILCARQYQRAAEAARNSLGREEHPSHEEGREEEGRPEEEGCQEEEVTAKKSFARRPDQ